MEYQKITAIVRTSALERVEKRLRELHVKGISVSSVKGYGEHANLLRRDWLSPYARIEIFAVKDEIDVLVATIMESAHAGFAGDGIVAVLPVERIFRIRTKTEAAPGEI